MSSVFVAPLNDTYAGKCKDRCENNRGGGPHAFLLNCKSAYYSEEEMNECIKDCSTACPEKYCPSGETILCEADEKGLDKVEIDIEDFKMKLRQEYEDDFKRTQSRVQTELIYFAVVFALVVILAIALSVWAYRRKKKLAAARPQMQQTGTLESATPSTNVQPYPPPAVHRHDLKVDGRVNSDGRVFIDGRVNNNN